MGQAGVAGWCGCARAASSFTYAFSHFFTFSVGLRLTNIIHFFTIGSGSLLHYCVVTCGVNGVVVSSSCACARILLHFNRVPIRDLSRFWRELANPPPLVSDASDGSTSSPYYGFYAGPHSRPPTVHGHSAAYNPSMCQHRSHGFLNF